MSTQEYLNQYLSILVFCIIAGLLAIIMLVIPFLASKRRAYKAKIAPYECGFEPFSQPRKQFRISFAIVAILFIIFDLELTFLFPWTLVLKEVGIYGFVSMLSFISLLFIGFIYEWRNGALDWN